MDLTAAASPSIPPTALDYFLIIEQIAAWRSGPPFCLTP